MAKQARPFVIERVYGWLEVYADINDDELAGIEGVQCIERSVSGCVSVFIDPRYDIDDVQHEIEELCKVTVPDVFADAIDELDME
jgi:hypothetical protein